MMILNQLPKSKSYLSFQISSKTDYCFRSTMSPISLMVLLLLWSPLILSKKEDPVCIQHADSNDAFPCEIRPSKEPLSLQYSKAQS